MRRRSFFSDAGQEMSRIQLVTGSDLTTVHIPIGQYQQLRSLQKWNCDWRSLGLVVMINYIEQNIEFVPDLP